MQCVKAVGRIQAKLGTVAAAQCMQCHSLVAALIMKKLVGGYDVRHDIASVLNSSV